jgi:hypothetical protein
MITLTVATAEQLCKSHAAAILQKLEHGLRMDRVVRDLMDMQENAASTVRSGCHT